MESLLRLGESVRRGAGTVRSSKGRTARSSVRGRGRHAGPAVRTSTHGVQQSAGDAIWGRQTGAAGLDGAGRNAVAGLAALSAANIALSASLKDERRGSA